MSNQGVEWYIALTDAEQGQIIAFSVLLEVEIYNCVDLAEFLDSCRMNICDLLDNRTQRTTGETIKLMNIDKLKTILEADLDVTWEGDNALQGLKLISEYFPNEIVLVGADHDLIYSVGAEDLLEAGLTEVHAKDLARLNWMIYDGYYLACYV